MLSPNDLQGQFNADHNLLCVCVCVALDNLIHKLPRLAKILLKNSKVGDIPDGPVVSTPCFQCRGHRFHPSAGT